MKKVDLYRQAYKILENVTPLHGDCGELCNSVCCDCGDSEAGMYLFPGEEEMYRNTLEWEYIQQSDFEYAEGRFAHIFICKGECDRSMRPLACRIFPLTPYFEGNELKIIMDLRGKGICPLVGNAEVSQLRLDFVERVAYVCRVITYNSDIRSFVHGISELIDDIAF